MSSASIREPGITTSSITLRRYQPLTLTWRRQWQYDMQTLTEFIAVENRIGKQVVGTIIEGLLKGSRKEYPEDSGIWHHTSPLIWLWYREGEPPMSEPSYQGRYKWTCREPHMTTGKRPKMCPGGVNHSNAGHYKESVSKVYPGGIIAWIDDLVANDRELVERQFVTLEPIMRTPLAIERWKRMTLAREAQISRAAEGDQ